MALVASLVHAEVSRVQPVHANTNTMLKASLRVELKTEVASGVAENSQQYAIVAIGEGY